MKSEHEHIGSDCELYDRYVNGAHLLADQLRIWLWAIQNIHNLHLDLRPHIFERQ
jgi:hypothetical protein